jgi:K+-transporting ATPase KdpF subunit
VDTRDVFAGPAHDGFDVRVRGRVRQGVRGVVMIWLTVLVTLFLFGYLLAALLRPERF